MNLEIAEKRYLQQRAQARMRKVPFTITFEEWIKLWSDSGKWEQRGRRKDQYCMSRIGDKGGYELGNVFIQLQADNIKDAQTGKTNPLKGHQKNVGKTYSLERRQKISESRKGKPSNNPKKFQKGNIPWNKGLTSKKHTTI